jgi:hypothetical protein
MSHRKNSTPPTPLTALAATFGDRVFGGLVSGDRVSGDRTIWDVRGNPAEAARA